MKSDCMSPVRTAVCSVALSFLAGSSALFAQDQPAGPPPADNQQQSAPANGQWRKAGDPAPAQSTEATPPVQATVPAEAAPPAEPAPRATMDPNYSQNGAPAAYPNQYPSQPYPNQPYPISHIRTSRIRISSIRNLMAARDTEISRLRAIIIAVPFQRS